MAAAAAAVEPAMWRRERASARFDTSLALSEMFLLLVAASNLGTGGIMGRFSPVPPCLKLVSGPAKTKSLLLADFLIM